jgi:hypothetical protein
LAAALIQVGRSEEALALLRPDEDPDRYEPHIIRGEAARKAGNLEDARSYFNARAVQVAGEEALDWAWDHLRPEPTSRIDIGSGLDLGYVRGFYGPETDAQGTIYRWATPRGEIRWFAPNSTSSITLTLALNSWRPPNTPPARTVVTDETDPVSENSSELVLWASFPDSMQSGQDIWSDVTLTGKGMPLSTTNIDFPRPIQTSVTSQPFVPGGEDPRLLGVRASTLRLDTRP